MRLFFEFGIAKYVKIWYTGGDESRDQADDQYSGDQYIKGAYLAGFSISLSW